MDCPSCASRKNRAPQTTPTTREENDALAFDGERARKSSFNCYSHLIDRKSSAVCRLRALKLSAWIALISSVVGGNVEFRGPSRNRAELNDLNYSERTVHLRPRDRGADRTSVRTEAFV